MKSEYRILYNPCAGSGRGETETKNLATILEDSSLSFYNMTQIENYTELFATFTPEDKVVISGGDGTLNRFINDTRDMEIKNDIYYFATGSGNDFLHDIGKEKGSTPFCINEYLKDLPEVFVNGKKYLFINGIGYGIDGYCCEAGDMQRSRSDKPVNYTAIAIKGLLFHYRPVNAVVTVDGKRHTYRKVWLAPTMNGRYYGGGMMCAPTQDRLSADNKVTTIVMYGTGKIKTLAVFPSIFSGNHIKHKEMVDVLSGHDITVEFDKPTALQIDGETISGVTRYRVKTHAGIEEEQKKEAVAAV